MIHYVVVLDNGRLAVSPHTGYGLTVPLFTERSVAERWAADMMARNRGTIHYSVVPVDLSGVTGGPPRVPNDGHGDHGQSEENTLEGKPDGADTLPTGRPDEG